LFAWIFRARQYEPKRNAPSIALTRDSAVAGGERRKACELADSRRELTRSGKLPVGKLKLAICARLRAGRFTFRRHWARYGSRNHDARLRLLTRRPIQHRDLDSV
jgi:hypothetical protein